MEDLEEDPTVRQQVNIYKVRYPISTATRDVRTAQRVSRDSRFPLHKPLFDSIRKLFLSFRSAWGKPIQMKVQTFVDERSERVP